MLPFLKSSFQRRLSRKIRPVLISLLDDILRECTEGETGTQEKHEPCLTKLMSKLRSMRREEAMRSDDTGEFVATLTEEEKQEMRKRRQAIGQIAYHSYLLTSAGVPSPSLEEVEMAAGVDWPYNAERKSGGSAK
jgi:uncharacterized protein YeaC (DUF1315 family)